MSIEAISRFNGGNGGVSVVITKDSVDFDGSEDHHEIGEFLSASKAVKFGVEVIRKAFASMNMDVPGDYFEMFEALEDYNLGSGRVVLPVKK